MVQRTEAIYSDGVLRPTEPLPLRDQQRVRLIIQPVESPSDADRAGALRRFLDAADRMGFRSTGPYPGRDELHERR